MVIIIINKEHEKVFRKLLPNWQVDHTNALDSEL